jgi:hypothetical protein
MVQLVLLTELEAVVEMVHIMATLAELEAQISVKALGVQNQVLQDTQVEAA